MLLWNFLKFQTSWSPFYQVSNSNSLWPSDAIRRHRSRSTLVQVMAWCRQAPSHYLNQCCLSSVRSSDIQWKAISLKVVQSLITKIGLKITYLKFHSNLKGANELRATTLMVWYSITIQRLFLSLKYQQLCYQVSIPGRSFSETFLRW